jgi:hypothetical protein
MSIRTTNVQAAHAVGAYGGQHPLIRLLPAARQANNQDPLYKLDAKRELGRRST